MNILVLTPQLPHSRVLSGHRIVYERIRRLAARGHRVGVACFAQPDDADHVGEWEGALLDLEIVPRPEPSTARRLACWLQRIPRPFSDFRSPAMQRRFGDMVERSRYDVVLSEFSVMAQFLHWNPYLPAVRRVVSCHQCETVASRKRAELLGYTPAGLLERRRRERLQRFEFGLYRAADCTLVLTPQERYQLLQYAPDLRTVVIPSGVDTARFRPPDRAAPPDGILFTGHFSHEQNRDAVRWFLAAVWPRVSERHPGLFFYIVGPGPPPDIRDSAWRDPRIIVTGEVDDVRPYLHRAAVFVSPTRMGSGMRGKLLEAMACEVPVVTTTAGAEGIPVRPGCDCLLADSATVMVEQICLLLEDETLRQRMARNGRELVLRRLSWDLSVGTLDATLAGITGRRPGRSDAPDGV